MVYFDMLEEHGIVVKIEDQFALVETKRSNLCGHCTGNKGCGTASLAGVLGQKETLVRVLNQKNVKVGDRVVIGVAEDALLKSSLALYLIPLLSLFVVAIGYESLAKLLEWPSYEILTALAGLLGLFVGLSWVKRVSVKMSKYLSYQPVIVKTE
jgi:sigma-E factor negative regulatory protein RseC